MSVEVRTADGIAEVDQPAEARLKLTDTGFRYLTRFMALAVLLLLGGVILSLILGAWPALSQSGGIGAISAR